MLFLICIVNMKMFQEVYEIYDYENVLVWKSNPVKSQILKIVRAKQLCLFLKTLFPGVTTVVSLSKYSLLRTYGSLHQ